MRAVGAHLLAVRSWKSVVAKQRGFSLIEMIVSIGLFAIIMLVAVGALLSLVDANRKARALESVMNNLNITLDSMVRAMRMGSVYNCGSSAIPDENLGGNCINGNTSFSFAPYGSDIAAQEDRRVYTYVPASGSQGGTLYKSEDGGSTSYAVTAPEVSIEEMKFYAVGTKRRDVNQPKVVIVVKGTAGASLKTRTTFYIQATAVQRSLDL